MSKLAAARIIVSVSMLLMLPKSLQAQADPDSIHRRNDCRLAAQVIQSGNPRPRMEWAWQRIGFCDPETRLGATRDAMQQARYSADLDFVEMAIMQAATYRDAETFALAIEIAGDRSASVEARVMAFVALTPIRNPQAVPSYEDFIGGIDERGLPLARCSARSAHPVAFNRGPNPLPADALVQIEQVRERVRRDTTEAPDVRSAAACS